MDTSKEYIKMCDCPEIQKQAKYEDFNYFVDYQTHRVRHSHPNDYDYMKSMNMIHEELEYIWLPRQDQIQDMIFDSKENLENNHDNFIFWLWGDTFAHNYFISQYDKFKTIEQLWLAFYMFENHQKIWDGEQWVKSVKE